MAATAELRFRIPWEEGDGTTLHVEKKRANRSRELSVGRERVVTMACKGRRGGADLGIGVEEARVGRKRVFEPRDHLVHRYFLTSDTWHVVDLVVEPNFISFYPLDLKMLSEFLKERNHIFRRCGISKANTIPRRDMRDLLNFAVRNHFCYLLGDLSVVSWIVRIAVFGQSEKDFLRTKSA